MMEIEYQGMVAIQIVIMKIHIGNAVEAVNLAQIFVQRSVEMERIIIHLPMNVMIITYSVEMAVMRLVLLRQVIFVLEEQMLLEIFVLKYVEMDYILASINVMMGTQ